MKRIFHISTFLLTAEHLIPITIWCLIFHSVAVSCFVYASFLRGICVVFRLSLYYR